MAVLKYYDGDSWEPIASALQGPTGPTGAVGNTGPTGATGPTAGLVLLNTTSFSGVSSFSLAADTFTATYDNYQIMLQATGTANNTFSWRGRTAGTDNTNSNYDFRLFYNDRTTLATNTGLDNSSSGQFSDTGTARSSYVLEIINPFASQPTQVFSKSYVNDGNGYAKFGQSQFDATTSFDAFTFIVGTGTVTGSYSVYGYNK